MFTVAVRTKLRPDEEPKVSDTFVIQHKSYCRFSVRVRKKLNVSKTWWVEVGWTRKEPIKYWCGSRDFSLTCKFFLDFTENSSWILMEKDQIYEFVTFCEDPSKNATLNHLDLLP